MSHEGDPQQGDALPFESGDPASTSRLASLLRGIGRVEAGLLPAVQWLLSWFPRAVLIASVPGLMAWFLIHGDPGYLLDNQLTHPQRIRALIAWSASVVTFGLGYGAFAVRMRRRDGTALADSFRRLNRGLFCLLALPLALPFRVPKIETSHPFLVLLFSTAIAAIIGIWAYQLRPRDRTAPASSLRIGSWGPWILIGILMAAYAAGFSWLAVVQHHGLATRIYDLGIYDNIFWQSIHGNPLGSTFVKSGSHVAAHVDPILVLLSPLYLLYPRAEFLLVLQSVWLSLGAIPLFLLARKVMGSAWLGVVFAAIYLLYPALHGANLYEFHSLTLAAPLLIAAMAALELGRLRTYALFIVLLLLTREDLALVTCFIGLYAILAKERVRVGLWTIVGSTVYLAAIKLFVMPDPGLLMSNTATSYGYAYYYKDLIPFSGEGTFGLVLSLLINPLFAIKHVFTEPKVLFLARLFLPLLFLPFLVRRGKIVLVYGLAFLFLSSRGPVHSLYFQYPVVLFPLAMALTPIAIAELSRRRWPAALDGSRLVPALSLAALAASLAISANYGAILPNDAFRGGFQRLVRSLTPEQKARFEWVRGAIAKIPPDASVSTSAKLGPHVSNRRLAVVFPAKAEYVFIDQADFRSRGRERVKELRDSKEYVLLDSRKSLFLFRRLEGARADTTAEADESLEAGGGGGGEPWIGEEDEERAARPGPAKAGLQPLRAEELRLRESPLRRAAGVDLQSAPLLLPPNRASASSEAPEAAR